MLSPAATTDCTLLTSALVTLSLYNGMLHVTSHSMHAQAACSEGGRSAGAGTLASAAPCSSLQQGRCCRHLSYIIGAAMSVVAQLARVRRLFAAGVAQPSASLEREVEALHGLSLASAAASERQEAKQ